MSDQPLTRHEKFSVTAARKNLILAEEIEWQLKSGQGWGQAMKAVGYTNPYSLSRRLCRAGRYDLAVIFDIKDVA
jgi:hypothetical protein